MPHDRSAEWDGLAELVRLDVVPSARSLVSITALLHEARELVRDEARAKSLGVVVVAVDAHVVVNRVQVVLVIAALLRDAIHSVHAGARVAVTAQEMDRELVVAVFDSGPPSARSSELECFAAEVAHALGARIWTPPPVGGNLTLFALPLARADN